MADAVGCCTANQRLAVRGLRRSISKIAALVALLGLMGGWTGKAAAQMTAQAAVPALNVAVSETGREIFDGMLPAMSAISGLKEQPRVKYMSAMETLRAFCHGLGGSSPDIVLTTRRLRSSLVAECAKNGVEHIAQVELGRSALILAVRSGSPLTRLTARQVYLALARDVPDQTEFRRNTAVRWSDIDKSLPQEDIRFQVPSRDDGRRALFNGLILEGGCRDEPLVQVIFSADQRSARCTSIRVDRVREIPQGQSVSALVEAPAGTVGVVSSVELAESKGQLVPITLDGVAPTATAILNDEYDFTTLYYLYIKRGQSLKGRPAAIDTAVDRVAAWALTEQVSGLRGLLEKIGLIPLPDHIRAEQRTVFAVRPAGYDVSGIGADGASAIVSSLAAFFNGVGNLIELGVGANAPEPKEGLDFTTLMDMAGYKTEEFQTSVSLIPSAGMTFGLVREMSESDQDYLERKLVQDSHQRTDALAAVQRRVVSSVLDVSEANGYEINKVEIEILPLPSVKLIVAPSDGPVSPETTSILRAIERLNERINELGQ